ncbi:MAG: TlpA family protein disulfide reductase [Opitutales bacterium]
MTEKRKLVRAWFVPVALLGLVAWVGMRGTCQDGSCGISLFGPPPSAMLDVMQKRMAQPDDTLKVTAGEPSPSWSFVDASGQTHRLGDYAGQIVVLNFWAKFCAPCMAEMPVLNALSEDMSGEVMTLGVAIDFVDDAELAQFAGQRGIDFPVACAQPELLGQFADNSLRLPTTIVIDREGNIARVLQGYQDGSGLRNVIATAMR